MEDKILITLCTDADHTFECASDIIGKEGEGYTTRLTVTIPTALSGFRAYLDFEKPNGEKIRTPELELDNYNVAFYDVVPYLLTDDGVIKVQAVLISGSGQIWKSSKKKFRISKSINAIEEIPDRDAFMVGGQQLLDDLRQESEDLTERKEAEKARVEAEKVRAEAEKARVETEKARVEAERARAEAEKTRGKYDCSSDWCDAYYSQAYLKITVPNRATIFDLIVKHDVDGGAFVSLYDFMTWRIHLKGSTCGGQCSTIIQDASGGNYSLHYITDDEFSEEGYMHIYLGFEGCALTAYINGILEKISATFELVDTLPSDAIPFTKNN